MNTSDIMERLKKLKASKALLTGNTNKKKRNKINRLISDLEKRVAASKLDVPKNQFDLSAQELHDVYSHIECMEGKGLSADVLFDISNFIAKCAPALLIPIHHLEALNLRRSKMRWNGISCPDTLGINSDPEILLWQYQNADGTKEFFDVRWVFENEELAKAAFEDEVFLRDVLECHAGFIISSSPLFEETMSSFANLNKWPCTAVAWQCGSIVAKTFFVGKFPRKEMSRLVHAAKSQVRDWYPCDEVISKLSRMKHYRKIVIGMRFLIWPEDWKRKFPIQYEAIESNEQTRISREAESIQDRIERGTHFFVKSRDNAKKKTIQLKHRCANCDKIAYVKCGRCRKVYYCDAKCQKAHYDEHKRSCKRTRK